MASDDSAGGTGGTNGTNGTDGTNGTNGTDGTGGRGGAPTEAFDFGFWTSIVQCENPDAKPRLTFSKGTRLAEPGL